MNAMCEAGDDAKNVFMFEYSIKNFSSVALNQAFESPQYAVNNLLWSIYIKRHKDDNKSNSNDKLSFFIRTEPVSAGILLWSCFAVVRLTIVRQKETLSNIQQQDVTREYKHLFTSRECTYGFPSFIDWNTAGNPHAIFIKNNVVKFRAHIEADTPRNIVSDYNLERPISFDNWLHIFEDKLNQKIVDRISDEFKIIDASIKEVLNSVTDLKNELKKTIDPIANSVQLQRKLLGNKLEKIKPELMLALSPVCAELQLLEKKIEESSSDYRTAVKEMEQHTTAKMENNIKRTTSELIRINNSVENALQNEKISEKLIGAVMNPVSTLISTEIQAIGKKLETFCSEHNTETKTLEQTLEKFCLDHSTQTQAIEKKLDNFLLERSTETQSLEKKLDKFALQHSVEIQALEKRLEEFCLEHITKVIDDLKNINLNKNDCADYESENSNEKKMAAEQMNAVKEKTVPLSVLKIIKEIMVESTGRMSLSLMPHLYNAVAANCESSELESYLPVMRESEYSNKGLFDSLPSENCSSSLINSPTNRCILDSSEVKLGKDDPYCSAVIDQLRENEKRKSEESIENICDDIFPSPKNVKMSSSPIGQKQLIDPSEEGLLFLGKNNDGEVKVHKVFHQQEFQDLINKYQTYKIWKVDEV